MVFVYAHLLLKKMENIFINPTNKRFSTESIHELSLEEIDIIKRGLSQLELILAMKEKQLNEAFAQIKNYQKTLQERERRIDRLLELNSQYKKAYEKATSRSPSMF